MTRPSAMLFAALTLVSVYPASSAAPVEAAPGPAVRVLPAGDPLPGAGRTRHGAPAWRPAWSEVGLPRAVTVDLDPVAVRLSVEVRAPRGGPAVGHVTATALAPDGRTRRTTALRAGRAGRWTGRLALLPQDPPGHWHVLFTAATAHSQTDTYGGPKNGHTAGFDVVKPAHPADPQVTPRPAVVGGSGGPITVRLFLPRHADGVQAILTSPGARRTDIVNLTLARGDRAYGLWQGSATLPPDSPPGQWRIATQTVSGTWSPGPSGTVRIQQTPTLSIDLRPAHVKPGATITVSGRLTGWTVTGRGPLPGRRLVPTWLVYGGTSTGPRRLHPVRTDAKGRFSFRWPVFYSGSLQIAFPGDVLYAPATSPRAFVTAK